MFSSSKIKSVALVLLYVFTCKTEGSCRFSVAVDTSRPLITRKFGSKAIILSNSKSTIELDQNERIEAYCGSGFRSLETQIVNHYGSQRFDKQSSQKLYLECYSDKIYIIEDDVGYRERYLLENQIITCNGASYSMFESKDTLLNCQNAMSYVLGAKSDAPIILAGLCYDLDKLNLNYVNYNLQNRSTILGKHTELFQVGTNNIRMLEPLGNIERFYEFPDNGFVESDIAVQSRSNLWLQVADYERASIIQTNIFYESTLSDYSNFFDIIWWHPLRVGNWNRFAKLLEKRAQVVNYIIYSGTSGVVEIPRENNCLHSTKLQINFPPNKRTVPQFIWTYLESTDDNNVEDFVVIAYNSPYFEYFPKNATVLCNDICDDIEWMKQLKDSRSMSTLGILYCCRPEDVVGHLDGFPKTLNDTLMTNEIVATTLTP